MSRAGEATSCEFQKTAGNKARSALPVRYHFNNYGTRGRMGARRVVPVRVCASRASGDGGGERNGSGRATAFQKSIRVTFIPENGFGRAGVDSEPERGGPPSVGKPGDLQLGFAIGAGVLEHLICGRRADRPTFRDSHELLAELSKALLSRKIIWFRVPITLIRVRLFTSKFNRIFLVSTHLSKPQKTL